MTATERTARAAARRCLADSLQRNIVVMLLYTLPVSLLALISCRLTGLSEYALEVTLIPPFVGLLLATIHTLRNKPTKLQALSRVDQALGLHDVLGSALAGPAGISSSAQHPSKAAFIELVRIRAENTAKTIRLSEALPIHAEAYWVYVAALLITTTLVFHYFPSRNLLRSSDTYIEQQSSRQEIIKEQIASAIGNITKELNDAESLSLPDSVQEQLQRINQLDKEIQTENNPEQLLNKTAGELNKLSQSLEKLAEQQDKEFAASRRLLQTLPPPEPGPAQPLIESLKEQDSDRAIENLHTLSRNFNKLSPEEKQRLADELQTYADHIRKNIDADGDTDKKTTNELTRDFLRQQGISAPDAEKLADYKDLNELTKKLKNLGFDPLTAEKLAQQVEQRKEEAEARKQAKKQLQDLADSLENASRQAKKSRDIQQNKNTDESHNNGATKDNSSAKKLLSNTENPYIKNNDSKNSKQDKNTFQTETEQQNKQPPLSGIPGKKKQNPEGNSVTGKRKKAHDNQPEQSGNNKNNINQEITTSSGNDAKTKNGSPQNKTTNVREKATKPEQTPKDNNSRQDQNNKKTVIKQTDQPSQNDKGEENPNKSETNNNSENSADKYSKNATYKKEQKNNKFEITDQTQSKESNDSKKTSPATDSNSPDSSNDNSTGGISQKNIKRGHKSTSGDSETFGDPEGSNGKNNKEPDFTDLEDQIRKIQQMQKTIRRHQKAADNARRQAERLLKNISPEEKDRLQRWPRQTQQQTNQINTENKPESSFSGDENVMDIRRSETDAQHIIAAEQYNSADSSEQANGKTTFRAPQNAEQLKAAQKAAQRAIEEEEIPKRFRKLISTYFGKSIKNAPSSEGGDKSTSKKSNSNNDENEDGNTDH